MPVPSSMKDLSTLAASNSPAGSDAIGNSLDDYLRSGFAITRSTNAVSSASIVAGSTVDLGSSDGEAVTVTGSATITSLGTVIPGLKREVTFTGACTLTNSTSIVLPRGSNYVTSAGDILQFRSLGSGNWALVGVTKDIGALPLTGGTITGAMNVSPTSGSPTVSLNKVAGSNQNLVVGTTAGVTRWSLVLGDATTESGSNAGSNASLVRYTDAGAPIDTVASFNRATGVISTSQPPSLPGVNLSSGSFTGTTATVLQSSAASGGSINLRPNVGSSTGQLSIDASGNVTTSGNYVGSGSITGVTVFASSTTSLVLAAASGGQILLRPNGTGSTSGPAVMDSNGNVTLNAANFAGLSVHHIDFQGGKRLSTLILQTTAPGAIADGQFVMVY